MTMPNERTRALRWVGEFLRECRGRDLPADLVLQIETILEHYPTKEAIKYAAENSGKIGFVPWLLPEDDWS